MSCATSTSRPTNSESECSSSLRENSSSAWSITSRCGRGVVEGGVELLARAGAGGHHADPAARVDHAGRNAGADQGGLAEPRRADHGEHVPGLQDVPAGLQVGVATEELLGVGDVVGAQPPVGAPAVPVRPGTPRDQQRVVLSQDRLLQRTQLRAGVDAQAFHEHRACLGDGSQCLALPAGLVLGRGKQPPAPLAQRRRAHHRLGLRQHLVEPARLDERIDAELLGLQSQLLAASGLDHSGFPVLELRQRLATPQRQRLPQQVPRPVCLTQRQQLPGPGDHPLETGGVHRIDRRGQPVAPRHGLDDLPAELATQPAHTTLHDLARRHWRTVVPQRVGQLVGADGLSGPRGQGRQHHPVATPPRNRASVQRQRS